MVIKTIRRTATSKKSLIKSLKANEINFKTVKVIKKSSKFKTGIFDIKLKKKK